MNDPDAEKCLEKAKSAFQNGDYKTAERLAQKAKRMFSEVNLLGRASADEIITGTQRSKSDQAASSHSASRSNLRQRTSASNNNTSTAAAPADFNPEQEAKCQEILRNKDYYKTLGLEKNCTAEEVKKAYRKLALQFHPDKAKCPSAEATFKELSKAYQCLSDVDARRHYDTYGTEVTEAPQQEEYRQQYNSHFMTPEELFESFFGIQFARGAATNSRIYRTRAHHFHHNATAEEQRRSVGLFQLFPLIALLLLTMLSSLFNTYNSPVYSLVRTSEYSISRSTSEHELLYFVKPSFPKSYQENSVSLRDLELQIEFRHFASLCERDQSQLVQQLTHLRFYGTAEQYRHKAEELRLMDRTSSSCGSFKSLKSKYPRQAQQFSRSSQSVFM